MSKNVFVGAAMVMLALLVVGIVGGILATIGADVTQDIVDDTTAGSTAETIGNATLANQNTTVTKFNSTYLILFSLLVLSVLIGIFGGYVLMR